MSNKSYEVKYSTMSDEIQRDALQCVLTTEYLCKEYNDIAKYIAKEFDRKHQPDWFCIVGNFGCYHPSKYNVCFCCHDSLPEGTQETRRSIKQSFNPQKKSTTGTRNDTQT